jgi:hypothetical protein
MAPEGRKYNRRNGFVTNFGGFLSTIGWENGLSMADALILQHFSTRR